MGFFFNLAGPWANLTLDVEDGVRGKALHLKVRVQVRDEAVVNLPMSAPPSIEGRNAAFEWQASALLDMEGTDPDSGWRGLRVA